jgi:cell division protein ZapA
MTETMTSSAAQEAQQAAPVSIQVSIYDQVYHLRGTDPAHIEKLAAIVDAKMRAVSAHGNTVDSLRVAVLASLNIADELATLRERYEALAGSIENSKYAIHSRTEALSGMLDELLEADTRRVG